MWTLYWVIGDYETIVPEVASAEVGDLWIFDSIVCFELYVMSNQMFVSYAVIYHYVCVSNVANLCDVIKQ